jgi:hypothetical protein
MSRGEHERTGTGEVTGARSRRAVIGSMAVGAGAALLGSLGQARDAAAQGTESEAGAPTYVLIQRFRVGAGVLVADLLSAVEGDLVVKMAEQEGFLEFFICETDAAQIVAMSLFGSEQGAETAEDLARGWQAEDPSGRQLEFEREISLGRNLRYLLRSARQPVATATPGEPTPTPVYASTEPGGRVVYLNLEQWTPLTGIFDPAVDIRSNESEAVKRIVDQQVKRC